MCDATFFVRCEPLPVPKLKSVKMCPECGGNSIVYKTLEGKNGLIERTRKCTVCGIKYITEEKVKKIIRNF